MINRLHNAIQIFQRKNPTLEYILNYKTNELRVYRDNLCMAHTFDLSELEIHGTINSNPL